MEDQQHRHPSFIQTNQQKYFQGTLQEHDDDYDDDDTCKVENSGSHYNGANVNRGHRRSAMSTFDQCSVLIANHLHLMPVMDAQIFRHLCASSKF